MELEGTVIMTTLASEADAETLSSRLLDAGLAACIQEIPITSRYRWEGEVQQEREILLLVKTASAATEDAIAAIAAHHSYDLPEILVIPATGGSPAYLAWLAAETVERRS